MLLRILHFRELPVFMTFIAFPIMPFNDFGTLYIWCCSPDWMACPMKPGNFCDVICCRAALKRCCCCCWLVRPLERCWIWLLNGFELGLKADDVLTPNVEDAKVWGGEFTCWKKRYQFYTDLVRKQNSYAKPRQAQIIRWKAKWGKMQFNLWTSLFSIAQ